MVLGSHFTEEQRKKLSAAGMGHVESSETRAKISASHLGLNASPETRAKMSIAFMGRIMSPETRAKISVGMWKGGLQVYSRKHNAKHRVLGFAPLNEWFLGCEGHHIDIEQVIYIPKELHRSIYHRQSDGRGMAQMNAIAYNFLFEQVTAWPEEVK